MGANDSFVNASVLVLSDTHGMMLKDTLPLEPIDVCIHAGDLTEESKLDEFQATLDLLRGIPAHLKLIIAGNHDFALDTEAFKQKVADVKPPLEPELVKKFYGDCEQARQMLWDAEETDGIYLLDEGTYDFVLQNGGKLRIYASPFTPSIIGDWGFQYHPSEGHEFDIKPGTDLVITHCPPHGVLDRTTARQRAGSPDLFAAVANVKPKLHCFGHIHEGWGAKLVSWRDKLSDKPCHMADIDHERSQVIEQLSTIEAGKFDNQERLDEKKMKSDVFTQQRGCKATCQDGKTLFVNAAIKGKDTVHYPWLVDLKLQRQRQDTDQNPGKLNVQNEPNLQRQASQAADPAECKLGLEDVAKANGRSRKRSAGSDAASKHLSRPTARRRHEKTHGTDG